MMGQIGTPVICIETGYVEALGWNQYGGWRVGIRSLDKKRYYYYAHLRQDYPYQAFSFKYSRRAGTPAAVMPNQVEEKIKKERLDILQTLLFSYQEAFNKSCVGKVMPVLFEQKGRHKGQLIGRTPYMQNLHIETESANINKIINVEVTEATTNSLSGKEI